MTEDRGRTTENRRQTFFFHTLSSVLCFLIRFYQYSLAYLLGGRCRFTPSCSAYALEAIELYGPWEGSRRAVRRFCRCHPWGGHGFDPVQKTDNRHQVSEK